MIGMAQKIAEAIEESMVPLPAEVPAGLVEQTSEAWLYEGGVATGKTQTLVERVAGLIDAGEEPGGVLVLCATPLAARAFEARLKEACPQAVGVEVTTARQWSLRLLARPDVARPAGSGARMLTPFEADALMEDLKTSGVRPGRLKEMLRFFYKSLTQLCDWNEDWLVTGEERLVFGLLQDCLRFEGGILEPQVANAACSCLFDGDAAADKLSYRHVLVDDYQLMSRASQVLANKLARVSIAVAANPATSVEVFDSYPWDRGVEEFLAANPQAEVVRLAVSHACPAAVAAVNRICAHRLVGAGAVEAASGSAGEGLCQIWGETPSDEMVQLGRLVSDEVAAGRSVCVVASNATWQRNAARALEEAGIETAQAFLPRVAGGDLRDEARCPAGRFLTALALLADPSDAVAWRTWCGIGDGFAASSAMTAIRERSLQEGLAADEGIRRFSQPEGQAPQLRAENDNIARAVARFDELREGLRAERGEELLGGLAEALLGSGASVPAVVRSLVVDDAGEVACDEGAAELVRRAYGRMCAPGASGRGGVLVTTVDLGIAGLTPDTVALCGFVDGLFPVKGVLDRELMVQEDADKQQAKDLRHLMDAAGKPAGRLVVSGFERMGLEGAERCHMRIARVQLHDGCRVALSSHSAYLACLEG